MGIRSTPASLVLALLTGALPLVRGAAPSPVGSVEGPLAPLNVQATDRISCDAVADGTPPPSGSQLDVCYADCNLDGALTIADFGCFQTAFATGSPTADCNADGALSIADFGCFQTQYVAGCATDIRVLDIETTPAIPIRGDPVIVHVTLQNTGLGNAQVPVRVEFCDGPLSAEHTTEVGPGETVVADVRTTVPGPTGPLECGALHSSCITAHAPYSPDPTPANNHRTESINVVRPYYDLHVSIVTSLYNVKRTCGPCPPITWKVRVANKGNKPGGGGLPIRTGVSASPNVCDWSNNLGITFLTVPYDVAPQDYVDLSVPWYTIWCNAWLGIQYIKADIASGDACLEGNCTKKTINIQSCP